MESRELYKATEHLKNSISWNPDWIHFGTAYEIDFNLIERTIKQLFGSEDFYLVHERTNSRQIKNSRTTDEIKELLGNSNFQLWNLELSKAIEFNNIGVMRIGEKTSYNKPQ